ncbi:MAG: O-antigen ligase C-terminal domain-containing protein [Gammaproteobacteria bacterium]|nr:O-antigen ligase C-terminal domain-containing protein [Gammaproteobacteria bacterium]
MSESSRPALITMASISVVILGLLTVIPFLLPHHGLPTAFYSEWAAFAIGFAACFPFFLCRTFWRDLEVPHTAIYLFAIILLIALQALVIDHAYVAQALLPGIYLTWALLLVVLCAWIRTQLGLDRAITVIAWLITIGGALQAAVGLVQYFDISGQLALLIDMKGQASVFGNTGQRNHFATQITFASFAIVYLHATDRVNRAFAISLLILYALVLTMSSSRAAAIFLVAGFLLSFISYRATRNSIHRRLLQGTSLILVLFLLFQYLLPFLNDWLKLLLNIMGLDIGGIDALVAFQRNAADGIDLRTSEWHKAWLMFLESPIWGIGIGHYGWYGFGYQALPEFAAISKAELFHHSHNLVMQVLAELGIVGLLLLVSMIVTWLRQVLPHWKNPSYWLIFILLIVLLLHSSVEFPLWYSYFLGIAAILLGLGNEKTLKTTFTPTLGQFAAGASLLLSAAILAITFRGFQDLTEINGLILTSTPQETSAMLHAISRNPLLTPLAEAITIQTAKPDRNALDKQLLMATRVMQYRPGPRSINQQIVYLALSNKSAEAFVLLKKAFIVYPTEFSKFACSWKSTKAQEVRSLWQEAQKQIDDTIECPT